MFYIKTCPEPESNQRHEDFQSSALPTELSGQKKLRGQDLNLRPSGYEPDELPDCSTPRQYLINYMHIFIKYTLSFGIYIPNGWRRIRTFEGGANRFTVCPLWPLGNPSKKPMIGLEPITCWLQISCSANWATSAKFIITSIINGTNRARTYDPLLVRQMLSQLSYDPMRY